MLHFVKKRYRLPFVKLKGRPFISKKSVIHFTVPVWNQTAISPRYACILGRRSAHGLIKSSALRSLQGCSQGVCCGYNHLKVQLGKDLLPRSLTFLVGFSFLQIIGLRASVSQFFGTLAFPICTLLHQSLQAKEARENTAIWNSSVT